MGVNSFEVTALVQLFRSGLLALLPVMDAAKIQWSEPDAYDPWENIQRALYASIIGSCVENEVAGELYPLAAYDLQHSDYSVCSFLGDRHLRLEGNPNILMNLRTSLQPFDEAVFHQLDISFKPTSQVITKQIEVCDFELVSCSAFDTKYHSVIKYRD